MEIRSIRVIRGLIFFALWLTPQSRFGGIAQMLRLPLLPLKIQALFVLYL